jgi:alpha-ketoglutarate-dependent taurine dioxygenase
VGGALGAEIHGVHLADVSDAVFESLRAALREHLVLFFPEQHLTPDQHRSFALRFGPPEIHAFIPKLDDEHQEIVVLRAEAGFIADVWHTDVTCRYAWAEGTIGIWDNRCTQHCAVNDYEGERVISRVTILGDHPEPAFEDRGWKPHQYRRHTASASGLDRN